MPNRATKTTSITAYDHPKTVMGTSRVGYKAKPSRVELVKIKQAIEGLFKVKVKAVNTVVVKGKRKFARGKRYTRSDFKKAIVTLEEGHQIDITTGL